MAFFNSRKRQASPPVALVEEIPSAPELTPAQPSQFSSAPLGASLRLVSTADPGLRLSSTAPVVPESEEPRLDGLRGLPLGTILFRQGLVQQDDLEGALVAGMESGERLGEVLIRRGLISLDDIGRGLAAQHGLSFLNADEVELDGETVALLPAGEAREFGAVAVRPEGDTVLVVTADPSAAQRDALETRLHRPVTQAVVTKEVFDGLLDDMEKPEEHDSAWAEPTDVTAERHDQIEEAPMDQTWTDAPVEEAAPEAWAAPTTAHEMWAELPTQVVHEQEPEPEAEVPAEVEVAAESAPVWEQHEEAVGTPEEHQPGEETVWTPEPQVAEWTPEPQVAEWTPEEHHAPSERAEVDQTEVSELDAQHDASVGRIGDLLARIEEGASTFSDLRAQIGGLTESLRSAEDTVADRGRRLEELTGAHAAGERRIEELLGQLHEREEELIGVGGKLDELSGRLVSAEQRLDDREQRLEELFRQVERRDDALSDFEAKLNGIAARFAEHVA